MTRVEISATEFPHFARLVDFLMEIEQFARVWDDPDLWEATRRCRADLRDYSRDQWERQR